MSDAVNHPKHYTSNPSGIECIQVTEHMTFCVGNAVKYLWRAGLKGDALEDLKKAKWYIEREIERLTPEKVGGHEAEVRKCVPLINTRILITSSSHSWSGREAKLVGYIKDSPYPFQCENDEGFSAHLSREEFKVLT